MVSEPALQTTHEVRCADGSQLGFLADGSVELVVTSPPYPMIEMWDATFSDQSPAVKSALSMGNGWKAFEAMHGVLDRVWGECARVLRPGGFACINIGDATRTVGKDFALYPNHARILQSFVSLGLVPLPEILWRKQTNAPNKFMGSGMLPAGAYVTLEHEFILVFRKAGKRGFNSVAEKQRRAEGAFFWEERNKWFSDLWDLKGERQALEEHERRSAAFPFELPYRLILMWSLPGDLVLDPFGGSGTTQAAALAASRNSHGVEWDAKLCDFALDRLLKSATAANERVAKRLADHLAFVGARPAGASPLLHQSDSYGFPVMTRQERHISLRRVKSLSRTGPHRVTAHHELMGGQESTKAAGQQRLASWTPSKA